MQALEKAERDDSGARHVVRFARGSRFACRGPKVLWDSSRVVSTPSTSNLHRRTCATDNSLVMDCLHWKKALRLYTLCFERAASILFSLSEPLVSRSDTLKFDNPSQMNKISDELLRTHVAAVLCALDGSIAPVPRIASFITAGVLLRLHNILVRERLNGDRCSGWSKQATLARVVGCFTGVTIDKGNAEYIGNAQDTFLRDYTQAMKKAEKAERKAQLRARKAGREVAVCSRSTHMAEQIYKCKYGGVPRCVLFGESTRDSIHPETVPWRNVQHADAMNLKLQNEISGLKEQLCARDRENHHNINALCALLWSKSTRHANVPSAWLGKLYPPRRKQQAKLHQRCRI